MHSFYHARFLLAVVIKKYPVIPVMVILQLQNYFTVVDAKKANRLRETFKDFNAKTWV